MITERKGDSRADKDLYEGLTHDEFCYVLSSRQMGKSSHHPLRGHLVHRPPLRPPTSWVPGAPARLREKGVAVVVLDLTAIGRNLSADQGYGGVLRHAGRQLNPRRDLEEQWNDRWFAQDSGLA